MNALVLLVDDSGEDLAIALRALHRANLPLDVRTARNGREALEALHLDDPPGRGEPLCPQVIFLDVKMPQIDGFEVLRTLRRAPRTRSIPVVMVSTSARTEDVRRAYELGANSYLVKRVDSLDPGAFIAQAARYWVELNFVPQAG
jgi:two-component system response regulator